MKQLGERETTFRTDFTIADRFGEKAIKDTYSRAFRHWKDDLVFITELVIVLNWKCWEHYDKWNNRVSKLYQDLWERTHDWCLENLKDEKSRKYYFEKTD